MNQPTDDQMSGSGIRPLNNQQSPIGSARRQSFNQRMAGAAGSTVNQSIEKDRPPLYVPTKREPLVGLRDSLNASSNNAQYQPKTGFGYVPSAEVAQQQKNVMFAR